MDHTNLINGRSNGKKYMTTEVMVVRAQVAGSLLENNFELIKIFDDFILEE